MKVKDLIAKLQEHDPELEVFFDRIDYEYHYDLEEVIVEADRVGFTREGPTPTGGMQYAQFTRAGCSSNIVGHVRDAVILCAESRKR